MAIIQEKTFHGYVLQEIMLALSSIEGLSFRLSQTKLSRSGYLLEIIVENKPLSTLKIGFFIKYNRGRRTPWTFTFKADHQAEIKLLNEEYDAVFTLLATGTEGVACLSYQMLKEVLDEEYEESEWIRIKRKLRGQYEISGKDGKLFKRLSLKAFPRSILEYVEYAILDDNAQEKSVGKNKNINWFNFWSN
jgi:hypothetical protein